MQDVGHGLQTPPALAQVLKVIAARAVDEQDERLGTLWEVFKHARIRGNAELKQRFVKPQLILQGNKAAALVGGDRRGLRIERGQAEVRVAGAIVEQRRVEDVPGGKVVLQPQKIVSRPLLESVGVRRQLLYDAKGVLDTDGIGKPETAALKWTGKGEPRIPVSQMHSLLDVDAGSGIGGSKAPAVVPIESFQTQDACTRVRVSRADVRRLDFHAARRIHIEPRSERAAHRVADLKSVHNVLCFTGARAADMQVVAMVLDDFRQRDQALLKDMGVGNGNIANVPGGQR